MATIRDSDSKGIVEPVNQRQLSTLADISASATLSDMHGSHNFGVVRPSHGPIRRALWPIYASDQLIFFAIAALPFVWLASVDPHLALYMGVGAYGGAVFTMQRSTPASLLLNASDETRVIEFLDSARLLKRAGDDREWVSTLGRMKRWSTDKIRVRRTATGILVTGRLIDLQILAHRMGC